MSGHYVGVVSPNKPRPSHPDVLWIADTLRHVEINYEREGSGPGSRFEGRLLEDVQAEVACRLIAEKLLQLPEGQQRDALLRELKEQPR